MNCIKAALLQTSVYDSKEKSLETAENAVGKRPGKLRILSACRKCSAVPT